MGNSCGRPAGGEGDPLKPINFKFAQAGSLPLPTETTLPDDPAILGSPEKLLRAVGRDSEANLELATRMASRIRDPTYSLKDFHRDLVEAFPELRYYMVSGSKISSGGTPAEEYLRTIGAAFAAYWLMRIGIDGESGFCFGACQPAAILPAMSGTRPILMDCHFPWRKEKCGHAIWPPVL